MRLVIVESPYAGDIDRNVAYAREAVRDSLLRGDAPIASHLLYTQPGVLRDEIPAERRLGIEAGRAWAKVADAIVVYQDLGVTEGMQYAIDVAREAGIPSSASITSNTKSSPNASHAGSLRGGGAGGSGDRGRWPPQPYASS